MIAENSYKFINIICRNKCPCPNCAEQNKQIYLAESDIYSFQGVLCIQKVGYVFYTPQKQLWGNCSSMVLFGGMQATGSLYFSIIYHFQKQSRLKTVDSLALCARETW